jgi:arylformamidase
MHYSKKTVENGFHFNSRTLSKEKQLKIYDITQTIDVTMTVYKDKPEKRPDIKINRTHDHGGVMESTISLDVHTGTHLDAPLHMLKDGQTIDLMPLEPLITPCKVLDLTHVTEGITEEDLKKYTLEPNDVLLFKTRNSFENFFNPEFIYLTHSGAEWLAAHHIKGVGTDALGIERSQPGHPTHRTLFAANIYVLEGLALADIEPGDYELIALPLKLKGLEASPVRAVLRK